MYNPLASLGNDDGLEVYVVGAMDSIQAPTASTNNQTFGIGYNQSLSHPGNGSEVDLNYSQGHGYYSASDFGSSVLSTCDRSTGNNCPVLGSSTQSFPVTYSVYVYWPLDTSGSPDGQNMYMNSTASVSLEEHAVQAVDNPLVDCTSAKIVDNQGQSSKNGGAPDGATYDSPNQPVSGWGAGFSANNDGQYETPGACPSVSDATAWTSHLAGTTLVPFYHPDN